MKKKKNDGSQSRRIIFTGLGIMCALLLAFLLYLSFDAYIYGYPGDSFLGPTATAIEATNDAVATLLVQTEIAVTQQFMLTSTVQP